MILSYLLKAGASTETRSDRGGTALITAALNGRRRSAQLLLSAGADIEARSSRGYTPLMAAAWYGNADCVNLLLAAHAEVQAENFNGQSAIQLAQKRSAGDRDRKPIIKLLTSASLAQKIGFEWTAVEPQ